MVLRSSACSSPLSFSGAVGVGLAASGVADGEASTLGGFVSAVLVSGSLGAFPKPQAERARRNTKETPKKV